MDLNIQLLTFGIILLTLIANVVIRRTERAPLRRIPALEALPRIVGESIEASRPLHVSLGSATIGDDSTMLALVGSEFIYYLTRQIAIGDAAPLFTVSEGSALPLAVDTLRRAYNHENRGKAFDILGARWYPAGRRSLAFAAALSSLQGDENLSGNVLVGRYGIGLALILDTAYQHKRETIAVSDQLEGQAIAYALADNALIGEEVFAAAGYLSDKIGLNKRNLILDLLRGLSVAAIILLVLSNLFLGR